MARRRSSLIPLAVLALAGVAIGAIWASVAPRGRERTSELEAELAALRDSQGSKPPAKAAAGGPSLCQPLTVTKRGIVQSDDLIEISGLVASRRSPRLLWAIEDSGAEPVLTALRDTGQTVGSWTVPGAENVDWEDLAAGPSPSGPVLYATDIGDNAERRDAVVVYRVPEPSAPAGGGQTAPAARLELTYPDGSHDAEALIVDPRRGTLLVFTKGVTGGVYSLPAPLPFGGSARLRRVTDAPLSFATAADVSADGTTVALRGYFGFAVWKRRGNEPLTTTVKRKPCASPTGLDDGQGESIALSRSGATAWTIAEGAQRPVLRYQGRPAG